jgi:hypothetical protein
MGHSACDRAGAYLVLLRGERMVSRVDESLVIHRRLGWIGQEYFEQTTRTSSGYRNDRGRLYGLLEIA